MTGLFNHPKRKLRKFIENGEYEEAIQFANTLEEKFSKDPDFLFIMGSMYYILQDENKTLHYIEKVLDKSRLVVSVNGSTKDNKSQDKIVSWK